MAIDEKTMLREFGRGLLLVFVMQIVFMGGGLLVERMLHAPVTGVPSLLGLTLVLLICALRSDDFGQYMLLGSFSIAFIPPAILALIVKYNVFPFNERLTHYSIGYMSALVVAVWLYFGVRLAKANR